MDNTRFFSQLTTKRNNQDKKENNYGKKLNEYCIATHAFIANGRTIGDLQGKFTCHEIKGSNTVDYAIINEQLKNSVRTF